MNVGFIGLGRMGAGMARNLVNAGHRVVVYNRTRSKAEALASAGALIADTIAAACHNEVVITMLADDDAVARAVFGDGKAIAELRKGAVHLSMSTISVAFSERLPKRIGRRGRPMSPRPSSAGPKPPPRRSCSLSRRGRSMRSHAAGPFSTRSVRRRSASGRSRPQPISSSSAAIS
jgi:3-hydroxyisobutyrate dehydrogenase-like beta-hydroxyacid dehydrogenase